ncbi:MAG: D-arabitol-phosphate dehydrogenase [Planctomycetes bacterium ADurb.Bin126]|nr:MAG: D-arabitol-phosphate dehydrogenase [Planctomycetes bacterium ADurb.Bin126]
MPEMMKAVVFHGPKDIRVETVSVPPCGAGEMLVKVDACAVCGSDMKMFHHGNPRTKPRTILGHEFTGLIHTIGEGVSGFSPGERVVMATSVSCGECYYCRRGWNNICSTVSPIGFTCNGGMAEYVVIPAQAIRVGHVVKVPTHVKSEHAALSEPLSCAVNSLENCTLQPEDFVVVSGGGPMGIMNAVVAREMGARAVVLAEINPARLKVAEQFGFDLLVNPAEQDLVQLVRDRTGGLGADVAIVAAPAAQPQEEALKLVRRRGTVCLFASLPADHCMITINSRTLHYNELRLVGTSDSTPKQVRKAVEIIAKGKLPADKLASHILPLDGIHEAFKLMASGEALRVVLKP